MNKLVRCIVFSALIAFAVASPAAFAQYRHAGAPPQRSRPAGPPQRTLTTPPLPVASPSKEAVKNSAGEQFFIIASVDRQNSQMLLKRPTEVTVLVKLSPNTKYLDDSGKPTTLASFRAGATVWAKLSGNGPEPTVTQIRQGEMTVADLHRYYLDYPVIK
jgi:hypothetical protein